MDADVANLMKTTESRLPWKIVGICLAVFALHVALLFYVIPHLTGILGTAYNEGIFADGYDQLAENLVLGNGYRFYPDTASTLMREPGYPILLAALFSVFGENFLAAEITNLAFALATACLMVLLVRKTAGEAQPLGWFQLLAPSALFLFHPGVVLAESRGGTEIVLSFLITLFLLTLYRAIERNRLLDFVISGSILGLAVAVRSTMLLFPVFILAYLLFIRTRNVSPLTIIRNVAVMVLVMFAFLSPWIIRNFRLTGKFIPTASVLGVSAHAGQYINEHFFEGRPMWLLDREAARERDRLAINAGYAFKEGKEGYYQSFFRTEDELAFSKYLSTMVFKQYASSPLLFVRNVGQNLLNFWFAGKSWISTATDVGVQLPFLIFACIGIKRSSARPKARVGLMVLLIIYFMLVHAPILAQARYSIPLMPLISVLAVAGLAAVFKHAQKNARSMRGGFEKTKSAV